MRREVKWSEVKKSEVKKSEKTRKEMLCSVCVYLGRTCQLGSWDLPWVSSFCAFSCDPLHERPGKYALYMDLCMHGCVYVNVCVYMYMNVCMCMYVCMFVCMYNMYACAYICPSKSRQNSGTLTYARDLLYKLCDVVAQTSTQYLIDMFIYIY